MSTSPSHEELHAKIGFLLSRGLITRHSTIASLVRSLTPAQDEHVEISIRPRATADHPLYSALRSLGSSSRIVARRLGLSREGYLAILQGRALLSKAEEARLKAILGIEEPATPGSFAGDLAPSPSAP